MESEWPKHLCGYRHEIIFYTGDTCPLCALQHRFDIADDEIGELIREIEDLEDQQPDF